MASIGLSGIKLIKVDTRDGGLTSLAFKPSKARLRPMPGSIKLAKPRPIPTAAAVVTR